MSLFLQPDEANRLPVSLLTGFLGSGKTTLLNRLIQHPEMARTAIIVNEFGDTPLDQHFIERSEGEVAVLANGCLCCNVQGDLEVALGTMFARREGGDVPAFDRLIIETSGLADPAPIMQLFLNKPLIVDNFRLDAVIATLDAIHGLRQLREHDEAVKQAAMADRLVITKTDLASGEDIDELALQLSRLNPRAPVVRTVQGSIVPSRLFGAGLEDPRGEASSAGPRPPDQVSVKAREDDGGNPRHTRHHLQGIDCFSLTFDEPIEWRGFSRWLTALKIRHADHLLRVKGILNFIGEEGPVAIHGVHHVFHPPVRLMRRAGDDPRSRIVFITRGLTRDEVQADWRAFRAANPA